MRFARHLAPLGSIALLTLLAALPWGLPSDDRFFLPLLPVVAIHYWSLRHDALIPDWTVFLAGFTLDILTHGPIGYWSLMYLVANVIATKTAVYAGNGTAVRLALLAATLVSVAASGWIVASIYFFDLADWRPYVIGAAYACLFAVPLLAILRALDGARSERQNAQLTRGV
jgi:rod shape-determining protein MreD